MTTSKVSHVHSNPPPVLAYIQSACLPTHRGWIYGLTLFAFSNYLPNSCLRDLRTCQFHKVECALYARVPTRLVNDPNASGMPAPWPPGWLLNMPELSLKTQVGYDRCTHINLAELDAVLRGINLALHWKASVIHLRTDSACVHRWISDTLSGKARVRTKAASEMLIRRRLSTLQELAAEYRLTIDVALVKSLVNRADPLTRVPQRWLDALRKEAKPIKPVCAASMGELDPACIRTIHRSCGHPGVKRTLYFVKLASPEVSKAAVREVENVKSVSP